MLRRLAVRRRAARPPADAPLAAGERLLTGSGAVWATDRALLVQQDGAWARLPWWQVLSASWDDEQGALRVDGVQGSRVVALPEPGLLPEAVRERVQASIVLSHHVRLRGRLGVRLVARRVPGRDDLLWQELADDGLDPTDPQVREEVARELDRLRAGTV